MYFNNIDLPISPASLTKLMTGLILFENYELSEQLTILLPENYKYEGKVAYLQTGDVMSTEQLLEFLLVYSANDAAYAAALQVSSSVDEFVYLMNLRAKQLGMNNTSFTNPEGLDDNNHFTTLSDLLKLSIYIVEKTKLIDITSKNSFLYESEDKIETYNTTNMLLKKGYVGLKTGWTTNAGLTFIGLKSINDRSILTIVNRSNVNEEKTKHFDDTEILFETSVQNFGIQILLKNGEPLYLQRIPEQSYLFYIKQDWIKFGELKNIPKINFRLNGNQNIEFSISDEISNNMYIDKKSVSVKYNFFKSNLISKLINK